MSTQIVDSTARETKRLLKLLREILKDARTFAQDMRESGDGPPQSDDAVREAAGLLSQVGLGPAGSRLIKYKNGIANGLLGLALRDIAAESPEQRNELTELFGPFPSSNEPAKVQQDKVLMLVGAGWRMGEFVRELIDEIEAEGTQPDAPDQRGVEKAAGEGQSTRTRKQKPKQAKLSVEVDLTRQVVWVGTKRKEIQFQPGKMWMMFSALVKDAPGQVDFRSVHAWDATDTAKYAKLLREKLKKKGSDLLSKSIRAHPGVGYSLNSDKLDLKVTA